jgi:hypothetical protein
MGADDLRRAHGGWIPGRHVRGHGLRRLGGRCGASNFLSPNGTQTRKEVGAGDDRMRCRHELSKVLGAMLALRFLIERSVVLRRQWRLWRWRRMNVVDPERVHVPGHGRVLDQLECHQWWRWQR